MKRRNVYIVLGLLTLILTYVIITAMEDARREVFYSVSKGKLKQLSLAFDNYKYVKGNLVFADALEQNRSWRVLFAETFADDFMNGEYDDILSEPTPLHFRDPREPRLFVGFFKSKSPTFTSLRAIHFKAGYEDVDDKVAHWIIAFLPMKQDHWTSTELLSQAEFEKILPAHETLLTPVYVVTESGKVMQANQLMTRLRRMN